MDRIGYEDEIAVNGTSAMRMDACSQADLIYLDDERGYDHEGGFARRRTVRNLAHDIHSDIADEVRLGTCEGLETRSVDLKGKLTVVAVMVGFLVLVLMEGVLMAL